MNETTEPLPVENPAGDNSTIGMLARGAGVELADVHWRVQAGLDPKQAVDAALAQKTETERVAEEKKTATEKKAAAKAAKQRGGE